MTSAWTKLARRASEVWAHQDSNLGQAGYEPAALTAELWAHYSLQLPASSFQLKDLAGSWWLAAVGWQLSAG
jgi:hypothetical protein